jgi:hypothetical protein
MIDCVGKVEKTVIAILNPVSERKRTGLTS